MKYSLIIALLTLGIFANAQSEFVKKAENAHNKTTYLRNDAVQFDIESTFGTREWMNATVTLSTDSGNGMIVFNNRSKIITNGMDVFYSEDIDNPNNVRFTAFTVPYFFMFPYKLNDGGTIWTDYPTSEKAAKEFDIQKLTFKSGTGDAPDDWYIVYTDKKTHLIDHAAYIVTAGKSVEKAEEAPHAIKYLEYQMVDGVPFATQWQFFEWNKSDGLTKQIGKATISNIKFIKMKSEYFRPDAAMTKG